MQWTVHSFLVCVCVCVCVCVRFFITHRSSFSFIVDMKQNTQQFQNCTEARTLCSVLLNIQYFEQNFKYLLKLSDTHEIKLLCQFALIFRTEFLCKLYMYQFLSLSSRRDTVGGVANGSSVVQIPAGQETFLLSKTIWTGSVAHPASNSIGNGVKRPQRDVDHARVSTADVRSGQN